MWKGVEGCGLSTCLPGAPAHSRISHNVQSRPCLCLCCNIRMCRWHCARERVLRGCVDVPVLLGARRVAVAVRREAAGARKA